MEEQVKKVIEEKIRPALQMDGGDIIFDGQFKNFELHFDWKVSKGGNSGIFYLGQEVEGQPIWRSSPEYQILDNINHLDARYAASRQ